MFLIRRPSDAQIRRVLHAARDSPFSYPEVGRTRDRAPVPGYPTNHHRARIGRGRDQFERAVRAAQQWAMYRLPWVALHPGGAPVRPGEVVAAVVRHFGFWSINPCRVVYVDEGEDGERAWFAFAIGTLDEHGERGEERFTVEWRRADEEVWFDIFAFAGARHWLVRLAVPLLLLLQRRFGRQAMAVMRGAVTRSQR